jgi:hypothetical protein
LTIDFVGPGRPFTEESLGDAARLLGVDTHTILAITEVETAGCGFLADRRPQILFERHIFHRLTGGRFDAICPGVSASASGGYREAGALQYRRLALAMRLDEEAALRSTSWGLGQTMGFNAGIVGYDGVAPMIADFLRGEGAQLMAIARLCEKRGLAAALRARDWSAFAHGYNGPNFSANNYDGKLTAAYRRLKTGKGFDLGLRTAQIHLRYLGFYCGSIDGIDGPATARAVGKMQVKYGLPVTASLDDGTRAALHEHYTALIGGD